MIKDYIKLAYISIKNRKLRSWLTMVGIFIGIAAVISLIGLGEGLRLAIMGQFNFLTTDIVSVQASGLGRGPPGEGVVSPLKESYVKDIERVTGVDLAIGRIIENAKMEFNRRADFTFAASMPDGQKRQEIARIASFVIDKGRLLKDGDTNKVVLGNNYEKTDQFGQAVAPRDKVIIQGKEFEVVGLLKKKGSFIIDNVILMNEDVIKKLFQINDTYDIIAVKVTSGNEMSLVKERLEDYLRKERHVKKGEEDFAVESPEQSLKNLDATLFAVQMFIYVIAGISIVVGGIGIANTMYTSVIERTKQIGIMKSIGAQRSHIFTLFLLESGILGTIGGIIGILVGSSLAYGLAFIGKAALNADLVQVSITLPLIIGALLFSFIIGSLAGFLPAYQAAKLKPVDALNYTK